MTSAGKDGAIPTETNLAPFSAGTDISRTEIDASSAPTNATPAMRRVRIVLTVTTAVTVIFLILVSAKTDILKIVPCKSQSASNVLSNVYPALSETSATFAERTGTRVLRLIATAMMDSTKIRVLWNAFLARTPVKPVPWIA